jgi:hypothetical protein
VASLANQKPQKHVMEIEPVWISKIIGSRAGMRGFGVQKSFAQINSFPMLLSHSAGLGIQERLPLNLAVTDF